MAHGDPCWRVQQTNTQNMQGAAGYWPGYYTQPCPYCAPRCPCCGRPLGAQAQPWWMPLGGGVVYGGLGSDANTLGGAIPGATLQNAAACGHS